MTSPYSAILHTNTVPSEQECTAIRAFLAQPREDLVVLEAEVERLEALLVDARTKRDQLRESISAHEALISPMRRIPEDILRAIFVATLPTDRNTALVATEGPSLIVQVCRYWREIALTTPRLWASMHIIIPNDTAKLAALKGAMGSWLEKSGAVPVDISLQHTSAPLPYLPVMPGWDGPVATIEDTEHSGPLLRDLVSELLRMLLSVAHRWRNIRLPLDDAKDRKLVARLTAKDAPLLQQIDIVQDRLMPPTILGPNSNTTPEPASELEILLSDSLRSFSFHGPYSLMPRIVAWPNLRHLKLIAVASEFPANISFPLAMLAECAGLVKLDISLSNYNVEFKALGPGDPPIELPELTECSLDLNSRILSVTDTPNPEPHLFDMLQTPALHTLRLRLSAGDALSRVFLPIGAHLKSLKLALDRILGAQFAPTLAALPILEELFLSGEPYSPALIVQQQQQQQQQQQHWHLPQAHPHGPMLTDANALKALIASQDATTTHCPALTRLEITRVFATHDSTVLSLLQSRVGDAARQHGVSPLKWFKCKVSRGRQLKMEFDDADGVKEAMETGELVLDVTFLTTQGLPKYSPLEGTELGPAIAPIFGAGQVTFL